MLRALLILVAVSALATLPCLVMLLISGGGAGRCDGVRRLFGRWRGSRVRDPALSRRERRGLARLDRCFDTAAAPTVKPDVLPIEKIAADLRRLRRQRTSIAQRSPVWRAAILDAYDDRLRLAAERLGITEHLSQLTGVDREIERVRVEGELEAAGMTLRGYEAAAP